VSLFRLSVVLLLVAPAVALTGCGGGGVPGPVDMTSVTMSVEWPVETQAMLWGLTRIVITVTGAGIATPVEAVIERPATSVTFDVPSGANRTFRLSGRNAAGTEIQLREAVVESLEANETVDLTLELYDPRDPADDTRAGASEIGTTGQSVCGHVLDRRAPGEADDDWVDWFRFTAQAGWTYEILTREVESDGPHAIAVYNGDAQLVVEDAGPNQSAVIDWEAPASGTFYVKVWLQTDNTHMIYCLKITGSEPSGTDTTHVNLTVR